MLARANHTADRRTEAATVKLFVDYHYPYAPLTSQRQ